MQDLLEKIIRYDSESPTLDFKEAQYFLQNSPNKNELLKDISAMANYPGDQDKFIVIGVKESNGIACEFKEIGQLVDEAQYQQFLDSNIEPKINFEYRKFHYQGHGLAYFRIFNNFARPYLFKKDVINPRAAGKMEYRLGDGFIRVGSSTRKLTRDDFERIYADRYSKKDRKGDIVLTTYIQRSIDEEWGELGLDCIDIDIRNNSAKSIDLDVQVKIFKNKAFNIVLLDSLLKQMEEKLHEERRKSDPYGIAIPMRSGFSLDVSIIEEEDFFLVNREKRRGERTALSIPQHDSEKKLFFSSAIVLAEVPVILQGEIIVRSDDFAEGALLEPFSIEYVPNNEDGSR